MHIKKMHYWPVTPVYLSATPDAALRLMLGRFAFFGPCERRIGPCCSLKPAATQADLTNALSWPLGLSSCFCSQWLPASSAPSTTWFRWRSQTSRFLTLCRSTPWNAPTHQVCLHSVTVVASCAGVANFDEKHLFFLCATQWWVDMNLVSVV